MKEVDKGVCYLRSLDLLECESSFLVADCLGLIFDFTMTKKNSSDNL